MAECMYEERQVIVPPKDPPSNGLPEGGTSGQVLVKTDDGYAWATVDGTGVPMTIDETLSTTSTNPVENKAIGQAITDINTSLAELTEQVTTLDDEVERKAGSAVKFYLTYDSVSHGGYSGDDGVTYYEGTVLDSATYQDLYDAVKSGAEVVVEFTREDGVTVELALTAWSDDSTIEESGFLFCSTYLQSGDIANVQQAAINYYEITLTSTNFANNADLVHYMQQLLEGAERVPLSEVKSWFPIVIDEETEFGLWGWTDEKTASNQIHLYPSDQRGVGGANVNMISSYMSEYGGNKKPRFFIDGIEMEPENFPENLNGMGYPSFTYYSFYGKWNGDRYRFSIGTTQINSAGGYLAGFNYMEKVG